MDYFTTIPLSPSIKYVKVPRDWYVPVDDLGNLFILYLKDKDKWSAKGSTNENCFYILFEVC